MDANMSPKVVKDSEILSMIYDERNKDGSDSLRVSDCIQLTG